MKNIDRIINHPLFIMSMKKIHDYEIDRVFCCHGIEHSLDVARVAYITNLEQNLGFQKEMIYAAALLHDIGRWRQYEKNIPHEEAGAALAADILEDTAFSKEAIGQILAAIGSHREKMEMETDRFAYLLYESDKKSRICWLCEAQDMCYWPETQKNRTVSI